MKNPDINLPKITDAVIKCNKIMINTLMFMKLYLLDYFEKNNKLTNLFLLVANLPDSKGFIKIGNQRVIEARLSDAKFFWDKDRLKNLIKQFSSLTIMRNIQENHSLIILRFIGFLKNFSEIKTTSILIIRIIK